MFLEEAFGLTLHGFYCSAEDITGTPLMPGQLKTSATSRTFKCWEFPRTEAGPKEIGNNEKMERLKLVDL